MQNLAAVLYETTHPREIEAETAPFIYSCSRCARIFHSPREFAPKSVVGCPVCRESLRGLIHVDYAFAGQEKSADVIAIYRPAGGGVSGPFHAEDCDVEEVYVDGDLVDPPEEEVREIELALLKQKNSQ